MKIIAIFFGLYCEKADFVYLREATRATAGNLSVQIDKLSTAGYIRVENFSVVKALHNLPNPPTGFKAFEEYLEALKTYFCK